MLSKRLISSVIILSILNNGLLACGVVPKENSYSHFLDENDDNANDAPAEKTQDNGKIGTKVELPESGKVRVSGDNRGNTLHEFGEEPSRNEVKEKVKLDNDEATSFTDDRIESSVKGPGELSGEVPKAPEGANLPVAVGGDNSAIATTGAQNVSPDGSQGSRCASDCKTDPTGSNEPRRERTYRDLDALKAETNSQRERFSNIISNYSNVTSTLNVELKSMTDAAVGKHNSGVDGLQDIITGLKDILSETFTPPKFRTPESSSLGQDLRSADALIDFAKNTATPDTQKFIDVAKNSLKIADNLAQNGNVKGAQEIIDASKGMLAPALYPQRLPQNDPSLSNKDRAQRTLALDGSLEMFEAANDLDKAGYSGVASDARANAKPLMDVALGAARFSQVADIPLSILEALGGQTVEFNTDGTPYLREISSTERAIAIGALAVSFAAFAYGGWTAVLGAGIVGSFVKVVEKQLAKKFGEEVAKREIGNILKKAMDFAKGLASIGAIPDANHTASGYEKEKRERQAADEEEAETDPSTPTGSRGHPLDVAKGTNKPATIGGRKYTGHALDRMQGRGVPASAVEDCIKNGKSRPSVKDPTMTVHSNGEITVITNSDGDVISTYPGGR